MKIENRKKYTSIVLTILFLFVGAFQTKGYSALDTSEGPELLITEVLPVSDSINDSYEYIEIYNNSDNNIDLKNYKLPLQNIDITSSKIIPSKSVLVICMSISTTLKNFNSFYGTSLTEDKFLSLPVINGTLKNDMPDTLILAKDGGTVIARAAYEAKYLEAKKSITYKYPLSGFDMTILGQKQIPTPGTVSTNQLPAIGTTVTGISLDKTLVTMEVDQKAQLYAAVLPATASNKNVRWESGNSNIVQVTQSGMITAKAEGASLITAKTYDGGFTANCTVIVKKIPVTSVTLDKSKLSLYKGKAAILKATIAPENATNKSVEWLSSNSNIASVDSNGVVIGKSQGSTLITVRTKDGNFTSTCIVEVSNITINVPVTGISLNKTNITLEKETSLILEPEIKPTSATNKQLAWSSNNPNIASIDSYGIVSAKNYGTAIITVRTKDGGYTAACTVHVVDAYKPSIATGVRLNKTSISIKEGKFKQLTPIFTPGNSKNKSVIWKTSDASVAIVTKSGRVIGLKEGKALITVSTPDGKYSANCDVYVSKNKKHGKEKDKSKIKENRKWD